MDARLFLGALRARLTRVVLLEGAARTLVLAIVLCVLLVAADYCWPTPGWFRLAGLLAIGCAVLFTLRVRLLRPLSRAMDDRALAQFVERRLPALDGRLLTQIDGIDLAGERLALDAALTPAAVRVLVPGRLLPRWVGSGVAALAALAVVGCIAPRFAADACGRLFLPLGGTQWARGTTLALHLDRVVVASDRKPSLGIERHHWRSGRDVSEYEAPVLVSWEALDGAGAGHHDARQLPGMRGTRWQASLPALAPGHWRITVESGDAMPAVAEVLSVQRPVLTAVTATVTPPAYAHLPRQHLATLACSVLPGSTLAMEVSFGSSPGRHIASASASVRRGGELQALPLRPGSTEDAFSAELTISKGQPLEIVLTCADGDGIAIDPEPTFTITPLEDRPPSVALSGPAPAEDVSSHAKVALAIDASDDYALAALELHGQVQPGHPTGTEAPPAKPLKVLQTFPDAQGAAATTQHAVVEVGVLAGLGDQLVLTGWAKDGNTVSGPGVTTSQPLLLRVVSDEALHQELDHLLGEARERVSQAREEIGAGLAHPERLVAAARSARLQAERGTNLVTEVLRRWDENQLPADQIKPAADAHGILTTTALPGLSGPAAEPRVRAADVALAKAEKLLASLLQEGDLTRHLADLIAKQDHLTEESRAFVLAHLTEAMDDAARARQASIAERQRGVADEMKEVEHQILANQSPQLQAARQQVQSQPIGPRLSDAANGIASEQERTRAVQTQQGALSDMRKLMDLLRGGDAAADLASRVGALAAAEEQLVKRLDAGTPPPQLAQQQQELVAQMQRLQAEVQAKDKEAGKAVGAAATAGQSATQGMQQGNRAGASNDATVAAALLRAAQQRLDPDQNQDPSSKKKEDKHQPDVLALLRELLVLQSQLVADVTQLHLTQGEKPLDFATSRQVQAFAQRQGDILLRLREEAMKPLDRYPVATIALNRVADAMQKAQDHLATPALGIRGMRLEKIALAELQRLLDIADTEDQQRRGGGGGGGGGRSTAAFPPEAELRLLAAMQAEIAHFTDANHAGDVAKQQADLRDLVESLERVTRPGSRPNLLLARAHRAMASAASQLSDHDRDALTRNEQSDAEAEIRRMIAESQGGGGGGGNGSPPRGKNNRQRSPSSPSSSSPSQSGTGASPGTGTRTGKSSQQQGVLTEQQSNGALRLELPEEVRERLREARTLNLGPQAQQLYQRYLELLEEDHR